MRKIGLTDSEIKVYLALLRLGISSKGKITQKSGIAPSKIYDVTDKLIAKGLASTVTKNGVKHFMAAPPVRFKDYLKERRIEMEQDEIELEKVMPALQSYSKQKEGEVKVEVFMGWKGLETVYRNFIDLSSAGDEFLVIGAGTGENEPKLQLFYSKHGKQAFEKGMNVKAIFNEQARNYIQKIEKNIRRKYTKRFLFEHTPTEVMVFRDFAGIHIRGSEPIIILIHDRKTADSFRAYFAELWKIAKE